MTPDRKLYLYLLRKIKKNTVEVISGMPLNQFCKENIFKPLGLKTNPTKKVKNIEILGSTDKIKWTQKGDALIINSIKAAPCEHAMGFKITL